MTLLTKRPFMIKLEVLSVYEIFKFDCETKALTVLLRPWTSMTKYLLQKNRNSLELLLCFQSVSWLTFTLSTNCHEHKNFPWFLLCHLKGIYYFLSAFKFAYLVVNDPGLSITKCNKILESRTKVWPLLCVRVRYQLTKLKVLKIYFGGQNGCKFSYIRFKKFF